MSHRTAQPHAAAYGAGQSDSPARPPSFIDDIETLFRTLGRATLDMQALVLSVSPTPASDVDNATDR